MLAREPLRSCMLARFASQEVNGHTRAGKSLVYRLALAGYARTAIYIDLGGPRVWPSQVLHVGTTYRDLGGPRVWPYQVLPVGRENLGLQSLALESCMLTSYMWVRRAVTGGGWLSQGSW